jgi:hypothetical protein
MLCIILLALSVSYRKSRPICVPAKLGCRSCLTADGDDISLVLTLSYLHHYTLLLLRLSYACLRRQRHLVYNYRLLQTTWYCIHT